VTLRAHAKERLELDNPTAVALNYVHESKVEGEYCDNCIYIVGDEGAEWRPCNIFPGKVVAAKGHCSAWMVKS
jgi:hypothetical protein